MKTTPLGAGATFQSTQAMAAEIRARTNELTPEQRQAAYERGMELIRAEYPVASLGHLRTLTEFCGTTPDALAQALEEEWVKDAAENARLGQAITRARAEKLGLTPLPPSDQPPLIKADIDTAWDVVNAVKASDYPDEAVALLLATHRHTTIPETLAQRRAADDVANGLPPAPPSTPIDDLFEAMRPWFSPRDHKAFRERARQIIESIYTKVGEQDQTNAQIRAQWETKLKAQLSIATTALTEIARRGPSATPNHEAAVKALGDIRAL